MRKFQSLTDLIGRYSDDGVEFGGLSEAPSEDWIAKAEARLGVKFPPSYLWFLRNYGGGEIVGVEVFSIYQMDFEEVFGGDVVFKYLAYQDVGMMQGSEIPVCETDFGEVFVMDSAEADGEGEYPVYRRTGQDREPYAANFADFLERYITEALS